MKYIHLLLALLFIAACKNPKEHQAPVSKTDTTSGVNIISPDTDTLFITNKAVVYYSPDSLHMAQWKKELGEEDFYTVADDWSYYVMTSQEYLSKINLPVKDASGKKAIKFMKSDNSSFIIRLDTMKSYWAAYLFTPVKDPVPADIVSMEESCKKYFGKLPR